MHPRHDKTNTIIIVTWKKIVLNLKRTSPTGNNPNMTLELLHVARTSGRTTWRTHSFIDLIGLVHAAEVFEIEDRR